MKQTSLLIGFLVILAGCNSSNSKSKNAMDKQVNIIFLHQSTGKVIWRGETSKVWYKIFKKGSVQQWFEKYNKTKGTNYNISEVYFPNPERERNYPFDYYNIWIKHQGEKYYMNEPTLETLTGKYNVIIWKHCFPVGEILPDTGKGDVNSNKKTLENYKLQYLALKEKMKSFPNTTFIVWTGAALTKARTNPEQAQRAIDFFNWVKKEWDEPGDNIYLWDFNELQTEGGLYCKDEYASGEADPHPTKSFAVKTYPLFCKRVVDVIEGRGDTSPITGIAAK